MIKNLKQLSLVFLACVALFSCGDNDDSGEKEQKEKFYTAKDVQPAQMEGSSASAGTHSTEYRWSDYIALHSQGYVSRKSNINIAFFSPVVDANTVGHSARDFIEIKPAIDGEIVFISPREIEIQPSRSLPSGQEYQIRLNTEGLQGFPKQLDHYRFNVSVIKQAFEMIIDGLTAAESGESVTMSGRITTADKDDALKVEQILSANYLTKKMTIEWQHEINGKSHQFLIKNIKRQKEEQKLQLVWNGQAINVNDQDSRLIDIPAIGEFKVASIRAVQSDRQQIDISFTEKLSSEQNIEGLVSLSTGGFRVRQEGNLLKLYPDNILLGEVKVTIDQGIKNKNGFKLGTNISSTLVFLSEKPQVKFVGKGVILPNNKTLQVPFEAVNVNSVQISAFQIFENNIGQFFQANNLSQNYSSERVGRHLWRKTIALGSPVQDSWNRYQLDVSELLEQFPGALFRLTLSINRSNSLFSCSKEENLVPVAKEQPLRNNEEEYVTEASNWDYSENYYNSAQVKWNDRNNPCKDAYFRYANNVESSRNFLASNIGIIAKQNDSKKIILATTNLQTGQPSPKVDIEIYNYQQQLIQQSKTDDQGLVDIQLDSTPFYVKASKGKQAGYLKLSAGQALMTSHFDVGGVKVKSGIKGRLYGERGVWRPGDDIFLTFALQDKEQRLPEGHPVTLEFFNPKGQLISSQTNNNPVDDFYRFNLSTEDNAMTGNWKAIAKLGGTRFSKTLKIESVIPNRLKVELTSQDEILLKSKMPAKIDLFSQWLHGAKASKLKTDVNVRLTSMKTRFKIFRDYQFNDPARVFQSEKQEIYKGQLDEEGRVSFNASLKPKNQSPGMLRATFTTRVFEDSGAFSSESQSLPFHPYDQYVGIKLPKGDAKRNMLLTDTKHKVSIASLMASGEKSSLDQVDVTLYKINWKWWWDKSGESLAKYASAYSNDPLQRATISTKDGLGEWELEVKYPQWGRYMVRVCDRKGGHCSGQIFYIDWPGWAGRAADQKGAGASVINLSTDKESYDVGETAIVNLPPSKQGKALLSIENASQVIDRYWVDLNENNTQIAIKLNEAMSPNIYVSVMLLQPHQGKNNDLPIRLYGVIPIMVNDPATNLSPEIKVAKEIAPQSTAEVLVSESQGKAMTYTLAIVDEGLLGITRYRAPKLRDYFYQKETLGIKTWDVFDDVVGAYGGELENILALGGDGSEKDKNDQTKKKRFPPVVKFLGPFHLDELQTKTHKIAIPQYLGAVRVMVVAGYQGAYGTASESVFVRQSVNLLATVPRVVGPEEAVTIPVAVFVNEQALGEVTITAEVDDKFELLNNKPIKLNFDKPGDKLGFIRLKVNSRLGKSRLKFTATNGKHSSFQEVYIDVRSANPMTYRQSKTILQEGQSWQHLFKPHGMPSTNQLTVEFSRVPPLNLESRLNYLIRYPHGCVEQTTSSIFPQLYLADLISLEAAQADQIEDNIAKGINKLRSFQLASGGFVYWPGQNSVHQWGNNYVGHFLVEAKAKGYQVPHSMLSAWVSYQKLAADRWTTGDELIQAYRLYTLAIANEPAIGAMNRLRERSQIDSMSRWYLAAAYQKIGQTDAANQLVNALDLSVNKYPTAGLTLGSPLRDQAIILQALLLLDDQDKSEKLVAEISQALSSNRWLSTQSTAYALNAMSAYVTGTSEEAVIDQSNNSSGLIKSAAIKAALKIAGQPATIVDNQSPIWKKPLLFKDGEESLIEVNNQSPGKLYVTLHSQGIPAPGVEQASQSGLWMSNQFLASDGSPIDVARLTQGTDVQLVVKIRNDTNRDFTNLALTQILPSGWEIHNKRLQIDGESATKIDYQDIRDDRILTYFSLKKNQEKVFTISINAAYLGRFYLPAFSVEAMYDASRYARSKGQWIEVVKQVTQAQ